MPYIQPSCDPLLFAMPQHSTGPLVSPIDTVKLSTPSLRSDVLKKRLTVGDRLKKLAMFGTFKPSELPPSETSSRQNAVDTLQPQEPEPEAEILARKIQHLVDSLPPPTASPHSPTSPSSPPLPISPYTPEIPLPTPTDDSQQPQIKDSRLIALLSNASFMNGSSLKGKPSIWSILENIHPTSSPNPIPNSGLLPTTDVHSEIQPDEPPSASSSNIYPNQLPNESSPSMVFSDTSSIMVYSPLLPTQSDFVELAELVPFDTESGVVEERDAVLNSGGGGDRDGLQSSRDGASNTQEVVGGTSWTLMWPFSIWYRQDQTHQGISQTLESSTRSSGLGGSEQQSAEFIASNTDSPTTQRIRTIKPQKSIRAWVPSPSKISVQAFWWGYRL